MRIAGYERDEGGGGEGGLRKIYDEDRVKGKRGIVKNGKEEGGKVRAVGAKRRLQTLNFPRTCFARPITNKLPLVTSPLVTDKALGGRS